MGWADGEGCEASLPLEVLGEKFGVVESV